ncbi:hypothetical protein BFL35_14420 [Clavibacter michiganensis]|nr:hypothetical protein BFL35_14420 [Clavibacter michiganensis]
MSVALAGWYSRRGVAFVDTDARLRGGASAGGRSDSSGECARTPTTGSTSLASRPLHLEAVGGVPNVEWLAGNDLDLSDGILVDDRMRVVGHRDAFAAGDIARRPEALLGGEACRSGFWKNAVDTGRLAGRAVARSLGADVQLGAAHGKAHTAVRILGLRIQVGGLPGIADARRVVRGSLDRVGEGVVTRYSRGGRDVGVAYIDSSARYMEDYLRILGEMAPGASAAPASVGSGTATA